LETGEAKGVDEAEDVDHGKSCGAAGLGCLWRWDRIIIATALGGERGSGCGNTDTYTSTAEVGELEKWATTKSVDTSRTNQGNGERRSRDAESNIQLCSCVLNTGSTENGALEVGDDSFDALVIFYA